MRKTGKSRAGLAAVVVSCAVALLPAAALAQFFKGREIQFLVSHPAGGGYDTYARLYARHLSRFLEGRPGVVAQNMPGAAGLVMANAMASQQRADGTVIALGPGTLAISDLFRAAGARYDASKLSWIGSMNADVGVAVAWRTSSVKKAEDLLTTELIVGGAGVTDNSVVLPTALNRVLGTKMKVVSGYAGTADLTLALERGEIGGIGGMNYSSLVANKPEWLQKRLVTVLLQLALERHPDLKDVPTVLEIATTAEQRQILELVFAQADISRVIFGPPGMTRERLAELRAAFDAMMKDREFLDDAEKSHIEINRPMPGASVENLVAKLRSTSPDLVKIAADAVRMSP